eukprot:SAG31_NODE_9844_length_1221_cov_1.350267_2_plen_49_part_01
MLSSYFQTLDPLPYHVLQSTNYVSGKQTNFEGGVRVAAFVGGGFLPAHA